MPLIPLRQILQEAQANHYAVGYFEAWDQYSLEAVAEAAEDSRSPIILGFGCSMVDRNWLEEGAIERWGALGYRTAVQCREQVPLLLNEVDTLEQAQRAIDSGFNAVMMHTSRLPIEDNIALTRQLVHMAHAYDVDVEGELGLLPDAVAHGLPGTGQGGTLTDPDIASRFVAATGVDVLSVSIGNVHLLLEGKVTIDRDRLAAIHRSTGISLAIHGGSGFPAAEVPAAISLGVSKFNVGTVLKRAFLAGIQDGLASLSGNFDTQAAIGSRKSSDVLGCGQKRMKTEILRLLQVYGSPRGSTR